MALKPVKQSPWLIDAIERAEKIDDFLTPKREQAVVNLKAESWPTRKTEAWKYTSLYPLSEKIFATAVDVAAVNIPVIDGLDSLDIVFVDGVLQALPSLPEGVSITVFKKAEASSQADILQMLSSIKPQRHLFGQLNDGLSQDGIFVDVAAGCEIKQTLRIVYCSTENKEAHCRVLFRLGDGAKASIIEQTLGDEQSFHTAVAEYKVGVNAYLSHSRFSLQVGAAMNVGGCHFSLSEHSELNSTIVGFGSELSRLDVDVSHDGSNAFAKMNAIYLLDGNEKFDLHTTIEHAKPHGTTEENVRGIVADHAQAVFNGRIHIHRDAQKTLAELNNRNLLMSRKAEINTKPELEIYADDVRCAHGATIAEIDQSAMYYLQSRGIDKATAQLMLNFGFINELVDQMPDQNVAQWLRPQLRERFLKMEVK